MELTRQAERRTHPRHAVARSVQFWHAPSRRSFPARSADLSLGGMKVCLPAAVPAIPGHAVRLRIGEADGGAGDLLGLAGRDLDATIVRVDRNALLAEGYVTVGVQFA
jgi:c-di-GMP-binding flagellar brake protein YcgR